MQDTLLSVHDLKVYYTGRGSLVRAVNGVSFEVKEGEVVALVGESGSGKTTAALSILQLLPPAAKIVSGKIIYRGMNLLTMSNDDLTKIRGKEIAMIFQDPTTYLNPLMKVGEQIAEVIILHENVGREKAKEKAVEILKSVKIPDPERIYDQYPHQLSGGMAQRVGIAIAIACKPSFLIADEPTSALDLTIQSQILHLLRNLNREMGLAILLITHDLGIVAGIANKVIVMYAGQVMEEADVYSVFEEPKHPYSQALLSASRYASGDVVKIAESKPLNLPNLSSKGCKFYARCPHGLERCGEKDPPEVFLQDNRRVKCWLYGK